MNECCGEQVNLCEVKKKSEGVSHSVMSNSLQPHVAHQAPLSMGFSRQEY